MDARIRVTRKDTGETYERQISGLTVVGRGSEADLRLVDPLVSRKHIELRPLPGDAIEVTDLGSLNGTSVAGEPLREATRVVRDEPIEIGPFCLEFVLSEDDFTTRMANTSPTRQLRLDRDRRVVILNGAPLETRLSKLEFELLDSLETSWPKVVSSESLGNAVWGEGAWDVYMLHNLIARLRRKLEQDAAGAADWLVSYPGVGYRLE